MFLRNTIAYLYYIVFLFNICASKPNVVLFLTDDQDLLLNGMKPMTNTIELIGNEGVTFKNYFVNVPVCCPSRSTLLTGRLPHNTGVKNNSISGGCSSGDWQRNLEPKSLAPLMNENGYKTFYAGKYLNQYGMKKAGGTEHVPIGWDSWFGLKGNSRYYNYTLSENGEAVYYADTYLTDLIKEKALQFLDSEQMNEKQLFMVLAPPAPHEPFTPAPRHRGRFPDVKALRTPAFNHTATNKHWLVQMPPINLPRNVTILDQIQQHRFESLLAVDELVGTIVSKFKQIGILNNTYFIYTSDNGYHLGQFSLPWDKRQPYDTDIRVPLLVRGPDLPRKFLSLYPVQSADLAPTILQMAGIRIPSDMDGKSFLDKIRTNEEIIRNILIEYHGEGRDNNDDNECPWDYDNSLFACKKESWCKCQDAKNNTYNCIRQLSPQITDFLFCRFQDSKNFVEAYDMKTDPYQLENIFEQMSTQDVNEYNDLLDTLLTCHGSSCV